jgi:hypothetical protein
MLPLKKLAKPVLKEHNNTRTTMTSKKAISTVCGLGFLVLTLIALTYYFILPDKTIAQKSEDYKQELRSGASTAIHLLVEQQINTATAANHPQFGDSGESIAINGSNRFTVSSWVDVTTSSGASTRRQYTAKVKYLPPTDEWLLVGIKFQD